MIYTVFIIQNQPTKHQSKALKININDFLYRPLYGDPRQLWILDSTQWISYSRYWIPDSLSVELGVWNPIVNGIPDSLSFLPDSKAQDSWFS